MGGEKESRKVKDTNSSNKLMNAHTHTSMKKGPDLRRKRKLKTETETETGTEHKAQRLD